MSDLISRQAAIDRINKQREHLQPEIYPQDKIGDAAYRICAEFIKRLPSAQPERKKGKWIDAIIADTLPVIVCDQCNTFFPLAFGASHNFCPNCGADMREEEQDD